MTQAITLFKPLHEVVLFSGETYFIPSEKAEAFYRDLNASKFIEIGGDMLAVSAIKAVQKSNDALERALFGLPETVAQRVRLEAKKRKDEFLPVTEGIIAQMVEKFSS